MAWSSSADWISRAPRSCSRLGSGFDLDRLYTCSRRRRDRIWSWIVLRNSRRIISARCGDVIQNHVVWQMKNDFAISTAPPCSLLHATVGGLTPISALLYFTWQTDFYWVEAIACNLLLLKESTKGLIDTWKKKPQDSCGSGEASSSFDFCCGKHGLRFCQPRTFCRHVKQLCTSTDCCALIVLILRAAVTRRWMSHFRLNSLHIQEVLPRVFFYIRGTEGRKIWLGCLRLEEGRWVMLQSCSGALWFMQ